jgi:hypothetical protein
MLCRILLFGTSLWSPGATLLAQAGGALTVAEEPGTLAVGSRVRVTSPEVGPQPLVGLIVALPPGAVVVSGEGGAQSRVTLGSASSLEVSAGRKSRAGRGAMIGAAVGAMTGILINVGDYNTDEPNTLAVSAVGAVSGAALGALVGLVFRTDDWRPAKAHAVSAGIGPIPRGAALSLRVRWGLKR